MEGVKYQKEDKQRAKAKGLGLFTVSYTDTKGASMTVQGCATENDIKLVQAAQGALINSGKKKE